MENLSVSLTKKIASRLRKARRAQGLTGAALATRSGLSKSRISNYENGIRRPGLEEMKALADALGTVSAAYLLCLADHELLSQRELDLLRLFRSADPRGQETILNVTRAVTDVREGGERTTVGPSAGSGLLSGFSVSSPDEEEVSEVFRSTRRSPEETERLVQDRFPYFSLDYATYEKRSLPASWHCAKHGIDFTAVCSYLLSSSSSYVGCPACREEGDRARFRRRFSDPDLERHLAVLEAAGNELDADIHRRRSTGAKAAEIAIELGVSDFVIYARLQAIRRILSEADQLALSSTRPTAS